MVKQQRGPLLAFKIALTSLIMVNVVGLIAQFPTNSFVSRGNEPWQMFFFTFVPQNWAFFTKDPQSENLFVYSAERNYSSLLKTPRINAKTYGECQGTRELRGLKLLGWRQKYPILRG